LSIETNKIAELNYFQGYNFVCLYRQIRLVNWTFYVLALYKKLTIFLLSSNEIYYSEGRSSTLNWRSSEHLPAVEVHIDCCWVTFACNINIKHSFLFIYLFIDIVIASLKWKLARRPCDFGIKRNRARSIWSSCSLSIFWASCLE